MPKKPEDSDAIVYLQEHGPRPKSELPVNSLGENVRRLLGTLNVGSGPDGGGGTASVAGGMTEVAYLLDDHDLKDVVRVWLEVNSERVDEVDPDSLRRKLRNSVSREEKDTISDVLDEEGFEVDYSDRGGDRSKEFECNFCGASVRDIASHLPECPESGV